MPAYTPEQLTQYSAATQALLHDDRAAVHGMDVAITLAAAEELEYDNQATDTSDLIRKIYG